MVAVGLVVAAVAAAFLAGYAHGYREGLRRPRRPVPKLVGTPPPISTTVTVTFPDAVGVPPRLRRKASLVLEALR